MKIKKTESFVKMVLTNNPSARDDDFILIMEVYRYFTNVGQYYSFNDIMTNHKKYRLPSFETITRARRKLQADYVELRGTKEISKIRVEKEAELYNYAKNIYK